MTKMVKLPWKDPVDRAGANLFAEVMREEGYTVRILPGEDPFSRQAIVTPPDRSADDNV